MKVILGAAALLAAFSTGAFAGTAAHPKAAKTVFTCPVTGDKIASAKAAFGHETYKGKTYYFCCPECKPRFDKNRAGTVASAKAGKFQKM